MPLQKTPMERIDMSDVNEGNSVQLSGTVPGGRVIIGADIFGSTDDYLYAICHAERVYGGRTVFDEELSKRFFRMPRHGVINTGDVTLDSIATPPEAAGQIADFPEEVWTPFRVGQATLELWRMLPDES